MVADHRSNAQPGHPIRNVGLGATRDDDTGIETREVGEQAPRAPPHVSALWVGHDRRQSAVVVEGEQHVRPGELVQDRPVLSRKDLPQGGAPVPVIT